MISIHKAAILNFQELVNMSIHSNLRTLWLICFLVGNFIAQANADTIAIIGTGQVAGALGPEFAAQGHTIVYGSRDPSRSDVADTFAR